MQSGGSSQFLTLFVLLVFIGWIVYRRIRPRPVRLERTIVYTALIVLLSLVGLAANIRILLTPLFLALAPVALLAGLALGWVMMRTIRFWRDPASGQLWMGGGVAYLAIWLATLALRLGIEYAAGGFSGVGSPIRNQAPTTIVIVASDLLFLSIGLWLARGYVLVQLTREDRSTGTTGSKDDERLRQH